ncbi:MAG: hypothetical protein QNK37_25650, partial [Acidobacteriota bacterium]|nr:hypothetical protein [Acidobacteriota bacterium]
AILFSTFGVGKRALPGAILFSTFGVGKRALPGAILFSTSGAGKRVDDPAPKSGDGKQSGQVRGRISRFLEAV